MKPLCLGTAMWGWSVDEPTAFHLLDLFYQEGGRFLDTAFNYPINGSAESLSLAPKIVSRWCSANKVSDLVCFYKFGSTTNRKTSENDLSPASVRESYFRAQEWFGENPISMMVHWDNREDVDEIETTLMALSALDGPLSIGLSGVSHPAAYAQALQRVPVTAIDIQVKSNFLEKGETAYSQLSGHAERFWAYGIAGGGLRLDSGEYDARSYVSLARDTGYHQRLMTEETVERLKNAIAKSDVISNLYELAVSISEANSALHGYIISPSRLPQLEGVLRLRKSLSCDDALLDGLYP